MGTCPRSRQRRCRRAGPQPDCASRAPSLCTKITREMQAGTLRTVGGSEPAQTGRGGAGRGQYLLQKPEPLWPGFSLQPPPRHRGTGRGRQRRDADEPERPQVPGGSPASVSRGVGGNSRTSKGLRFRLRGPGQAPGRGRRVVPGSQRGDTQGGRPWGVVWSCGRRTKQRHHPAVQANGMNGL